MIVFEGSISVVDRIQSDWVHARPRPVFVVLGGLLLGVGVFAIVAPPRGSPTDGEVRWILRGLLLLSLASYCWRLWVISRHTRGAVARVELMSDAVRISSRDGEAQRCA